MEFGTRSIRSAGQGSGSAEVTLPAAFRGLVGLPCRLALRDGLRPEIMMQPELRAARLALAKLWAMLTEVLVTLWPGERNSGGRPRLAWSNGLALAGPAPHGAALLVQEGILPGAALAAAEDALSPAFAAAARPTLRLLRDAHLDWTAEPLRDAALLAAWRRDVAVEFGGA